MRYLISILICLIAVGLGIGAKASSEFEEERKQRCSIVLQSADFDAIMVPVDAIENSRPVWQMQSPYGSLESEYLSFSNELRRWRVGPLANSTSFKSDSDKFFVSDTWFNGYWNCFQETIDLLSSTDNVAGRLYALRQNPNKDKVVQCRPPQVEHQIIHTIIDDGGERKDIEVSGSVPWLQAACVSGAVSQYPNAVAVQYYNENVEKRGNVVRKCEAILPGARKPSHIPTSDKGYTSCVFPADDEMLEEVDPDVTPAVVTPAVTTPAVTTPAVTTPAVTTQDNKVPEEMLEMLEEVDPDVTPAVTTQDNKVPEDQNATKKEKCCKQKKCWKLRKGTNEKLEEVPVNA